MTNKFSKEHKLFGTNILGVITMI